MPFIGRQPVIGNFQKCDSISVVNGQAAYTLQVGGVNVSPQSENHMLVSLNGILQSPVDSFTVSGSTLTFASNLVTGDVIDFVMILGNVLDLGVPSDNTVSLAKLTATGTKDATTFLRGDNTFSAVDSPAIVKLQTQTASSSSSITFTSTYLTSTYKKYYLDYTNVIISSDGGNISATVSYDNGSSYVTSGYYSHRIFSNSGTASNSLASSGGTNNSSLLMIGTGDGLGTSTDESGSGRMTIFDPNSADSKFFISEGIMITNSGALAQQYIYQGLITSSTINNIKITPNTGTMDGIFTLYGVTT